MTTQTETMEGPETSVAGKTIQVRYLGMQPSFQHFPPTPLFNVVGGEGYRPDSTVTLRTLFRLGLRVEVVP